MPCPDGITSLHPAHWLTSCFFSSHTGEHVSFGSPVPPPSMNSYSVLPSPHSLRSSYTQTAEPPLSVFTQTTSLALTNLVADAGTNPASVSAPVELPAVQGTPNTHPSPRHPPYDPPHSATPPRSPEYAGGQRPAKYTNPPSGDSGIADMDDGERRRMEDLLKWVTKLVHWKYHSLTISKQYAFLPCLSWK